jgi:DNA (cytosine-5)-methyltransferase 1
MTQHQVSYQTIGTNKTRPRLWIEGVKLGAAGFTKGARYTLSFEDGTMILELDPDGSRKVSGKTRHGRDIPIMDIALKELDDHFGTDARVRVVFTQNRITVSLHHETAAQNNRETRFCRALDAGTLTEASMFTGGGISTHAIHSAIEDAGHKARLAWVVDAELKYLQAGYAGNYAITDETTALIGRAEEIETTYFKPVDILSFSMPCSGFSKAGKAKHGHNPEAHEGASALFGTMNAIRASNPAVLISENVIEAQNSPSYILLKSELTRLGYDIFDRVMTSADTGSIEERKRYWFVALSRGLSADFSFDMIHPEALKDKACLADIFDADVPESAWSDHQYLKDKAVRDAADGKGFSRQLLSGEETSCGTIGRFYNKRRSTEPFITREDGKERLLTRTEHARVKSVPEEIVADLAPTVAHEILGQSIDYRQAYIAMAAVMAHFTGSAIQSVTRAARTVAEKVRIEDPVPAQSQQLQLF